MRLLHLRKARANNRLREMSELRRWCFAECQIVAHRRTVLAHRRCGCEPDTAQGQPWRGDRRPQRRSALGGVLKTPVPVENRRGARFGTCLRGGADLGHRQMPQSLPCGLIRISQACAGRAGEVGGGQRPRHEISLDQVAPESGERIEAGRRLDAFSDDFQSEYMAPIDG